MMINKKGTNSTYGLPTIGFIGSSGFQFFHLAWLGIAEVARENNINAINFVGQYLQDTRDFNAQANIIYEMVDNEQLDGLIIQNINCNLLNDDETQKFYDRYKPLPIVSLGRKPMKGVISCIGSTGYSGMYELFVHLVKIHGYRRIGFIKGISNYAPHEERYKAYVDVLAEYNLPFEQARVVVPRNIVELEKSRWGNVAICRLLDEQNADIDVLVTNDDGYVPEILSELEKRGIRVPEDIALACFGDCEMNYCQNPPLTAVPVPIYEMGRQSALTLLAALEGKKGIDRKIDVPSNQLIVRQSCGCLEANLTQVVAGKLKRKDILKSFKANVNRYRKTIISEIIHAAGNSVNGLNSNWAEKLLDNFITDITKAKDKVKTNLFLSILNKILHEALSARGNIDEWSQVLTTMRRQLLPCFTINNSDTIIRNRAENLWMQSQVMVGNINLWKQANKKLHADQQKQISDDINISLATAFELYCLVDILAKNLPRLGILQGYLSLYENPGAYKYPQSAPEWSRLVMSYDKNRPVESLRQGLGASGHRFLTRKLLPENVLPQQRTYTLVVLGLYFHKKQIGTLILQGDHKDIYLYDSLRAQISSALEVSLLMKQSNLYNNQKKAMLQANKANKAKTQFFQNMSHELRTPLNAITGVNYLLEKTKLNSTQKDYIKIIQYSAQNMLSNINDILDFSKIEVGKISIESDSFNLLDMIKGLHDILSIKAHEKGLLLNYSVPNDIPVMLIGDQFRMEQILMNLVNNGIKFTETGEIHIDVSCISKMKDKVILKFSVKDTGIGLKKSQISKLFKPFVQADVSTTRKFGGTGLGLSICKGLIELLGGKIGITSRVNKGSTFFFTLPFEINKGVQFKSNKAKLSKEEIQSINGINILIVDDNKINQQIAKEILERIHVNCMIKENGRDAVNYLLNSKNSIQLILMDLQMPVMGGIEAASKIRKIPEYKKIPIIALTADIMPESKKRVFEVGMNDYLIKPFLPDVLYKKVFQWTGLKSSETNKIPSHDIQRIDFSLLNSEIDIEKGLRFTSNNEQLYKKLLIDFHKNYWPFLKIYSRNIENNYRQAVAKQLHTLKGASGTLGMTKLQLTAEKLENLVKTGNNGKKYDKLYVSLEKKLTLIITTLSEFKNKYQKIPDKKPDKKNLSENEKIKALENLKQLVENFDTGAKCALNNLKGSSKKFMHKDDMDKLESLINKYDYSNALDMINNVISNMTNRH